VVGWVQLVLVGIAGMTAGYICEKGTGMSVVMTKVHRAGWAEDQA
jgi:hypothetical protein